MKQSYFTGVKEILPGGDALRKHSFRATKTRDCYALLAAQNCQFLVVFALLRVESALLALVNRHLAHGFVMTRGESVHFYNQDCFECLLPHTKTA